MWFNVFVGGRVRELTADWWLIDLGLYLSASHSSEWFFIGSK
jgi:hypothetical protein